MRHPCVALAECCEFLDHIRRPVKESERINGPYPYFGANGQQGWINDYLFDEALVLLAEDGGHFSNPQRGIAYKINGKTWVNNHAHVLRPREGIIDVDYLTHALRNKDVRRHLSGSTRDKLTKAGASQIEIPLPPLEEQRRIAAILDRGNQLSQLRDRSRKALETLKQAIFRSALASHEASSSGPTAIELGDCLSFITSGGRGWSQYYADSGSRFIRSGDVRMNQINQLSPQYISPPDNAEARRTRILDGDVLLTITGSRIGRVAPAASDDSGAYVSQHVAILRLDRSKLIPSFVSFFLSMPGLGQSQIKKAQYGQTKPGLNFEQIRRFSVPSLSIDKQQQVMNKIESVQSLLDFEQSQSLAINEMLASLCIQAFSEGF